MAIKLDTPPMNTAELNPYLYKTIEKLNFELNNLEREITSLKMDIEMLEEKMKGD